MSLADMETLFDGTTRGITTSMTINPGRDDLRDVSCRRRKQARRTTRPARFRTTS
jgi:hypothetical protein